MATLRVGRTRDPWAYGLTPEGHAMSDHDQDRSTPAPELGGCLILLLAGLGSTLPLALKALMT